MASKKEDEAYISPEEIKKIADDLARDIRLEELYKVIRGRDLMLGTTDGAKKFIKLYDFMIARLANLTEHVKEQAKDVKLEKEDIVQIVGDEVFKICEELRTYDFEDYVTIDTIRRTYDICRKEERQLREMNIIV